MGMKNVTSTSYWLFIAGLFVFSLLVAFATIVRLITHPLLFILAVPSAIIAADFLSGVFHWACDTWGKQSMPFIGPTLLASFRNHHKDQQGIVRHNFAEVNGHNVMAAAPLIFLVYMIIPTTLLGVFLHALALLTLIGILLTNQIHKWAHSDKVPRAVVFLQECGVILSPKQHRLHHTRPYVSTYCITSGCLNSFFEKIGFFRFLEKIISSVTGAEPREDER